MREVLSNFLLERATTDRNFLVLSGDHGYALFDRIRTQAPEQFINVGVTEQAMIGCAAGLAKTGKRVVVYGLSAFVPLRVLEFIKLSICFENLPVIIIGDGAGAVYTTLGVSHQCFEDIACLRPLPIKIFAPADDHEMRYCLNRAMKESGPCYIRIGKADKPRVHNQPIGADSPLLLVKDGTARTAIIAMGSMVSTACQLADGLDIPVYSFPEITLLNDGEIASRLRGYEHVLTLEEHSVYGGIGSIIGDLILEFRLRTTLTKIGALKPFTHGAGSYDYAMQYHGLDIAALKERLMKHSIQTGRQITA